MAPADPLQPKKPAGIPRPSSSRRSISITKSVGKALADVMNNPSHNPTASLPAKSNGSKRLSLTSTFSKKAIPAPIATAPPKSGNKSPQRQAASALPSPPASSPTFDRRTAPSPTEGISPIKPKPTTTPNTAASALPKYRPKTTGIISGSKPSAFSPARRKRRGSSDEDADQSASATDVSLAARPVSPLPRRGVTRASLLGTAVAAAPRTKPVVPPIIIASSPTLPPASNSPIKLVEPKKRRTAAPAPSTTSSTRSSPRAALPLKPGTPSISRPASAASRTRTHSSASNHTSASTRKPIPSGSSAKDKENRTRASPSTTPQSTQRTTPRALNSSKGSPSTPSRLPASTSKANVGSLRKPSTVIEEPLQREGAPDYPDTSMESIDAGDVSALLEIDHLPSPAKPLPIGRTGPARLRPGAAYGNIGFGSPQTPPRELPGRSAMSYLSPPLPRPDDMSPSPSHRPRITDTDRRSRTSILSWEQFSHSRISSSGLDLLSNMPVPFISSTPGIGNTPLMSPVDESMLSLPGAPRPRVDSGWGPESPTPFLLDLSRSSSPHLPGSRRTSGRPSLPRGGPTTNDDSPSIGQVMFPGAADQSGGSLSTSQRRTSPRALATPPEEDDDDTAGALVALLRLQLASAEDRAQRSEQENKLLSDELTNRMHVEEEQRLVLEAEKEAELNAIRQAMEEEKHEVEQAMEGLTLEVQKRTEIEEELKAALEAAERSVEDKERQTRLEREQRMDSAEHLRIITNLRRKHDLELAMREAEEAYRTARLAIEQELELVSLWKEVTNVFGDCLSGAATVVSGQFLIST